MPTLITLTGALHLPAAFVTGQDMAAIEAQLCHAGMLPGQAQQRRWRMDHEHPGGYILEYTCVVARRPEETSWPVSC